MRGLQEPNRCSTHARDAGMASPDMVNGACVYIAADCPMISGQCCWDAQARAEIVFS